MTFKEVESKCNAMPLALAYLEMKSFAEKAEAKLSERKTIHEWLTSIGTPSMEFGTNLCLLRRLRILCDKHRKFEEAFHDLLDQVDLHSPQLSIIADALKPHKDGQ